MHSLLQRQLKRAGMTPDKLPDTAPWRKLLESISQAYEQNDRDRYLMERSMSISSDEMRDLNKRVANERDALQLATEALQRASRQLELALDAGGLAAWEWDIERGSLSFDSRFRARYGIDDSLYELDVQAWIARLHPEDVPSVNRAIEQHLSGQLPAYESEHRVRLADGSWIWVFDRGMVVAAGKDGKPSRMLGTHADITLRKLRHAQQVQTQRMESIGLLAAGIAHEMNTPIQYVADNVRFLRDQLPLLVERVRAEAQAGAHTDQNDEACSDLAFAIQEIPPAIKESLDGLERVTRIVRAMKEFSHPGAEKKEAADLNRAIEATTIVCRNRWNDHAELACELDAALPPVVCHLPEINQVVLNLIVNAADAIAERRQAQPEHAGKIVVRTRVTETHAIVEIEDNGAGISESNQAKIFSQFFTTKAVGSGTGQGLAMCYNIVTARHGGEIEFRSTPGIGTTFVMTLPLDVHD